MKARFNFVAKLVVVLGMGFATSQAYVFSLWPESHAREKNRKSKAMHEESLRISRVHGWLSKIRKIHV